MGRNLFGTWHTGGRMIAVLLAAAIFLPLSLGITVSAGSIGNPEMGPVQGHRDLRRQAGAPTRLAEAGSSAAGGPGLRADSRTVNILLVGRDDVRNSASRSDAMILCTFNKDRNTITITSFLRDMYVKIPGHHKDRINAAYCYGGMPLLEKTLYENFGIEADGTIQVDFGCFERIIDKLGGVAMELTSAEAAFINKHLKGSALTKGTHMLSGAQALLYARNRHDTDGDFSRTNRQRKLLKELLKTYKNQSLPQMLGLIQEILPMLTTDITKAELTAYAVSLLPMLSGAQVRMQAIPASGTYRYAVIDGKSVILPEVEKNRRILQEILS